MPHCGSYAYTAYGEEFSSNIPFLCHVHSAHGLPRRRLQFCQSLAWSQDRWRAATRISPVNSSDDVDIRRDGGDWAIRFPDGSEFVFAAGEFRGFFPDPGDQVLAEINFLDFVLPFFLELRDVPFLHASAVEWGGRAVAFSAFAGGGKSSLTTALTLRGGGFVTDDVLVIGQSDLKYIVYPGYPQIRLWRDAAERLLPSVAHEPIHPRWPKRRGIVESWGRSVRDPLTLAAIYLLDSTAGNGMIEVVSLTCRTAFFKLFDNLPALAALDNQAQARRTEFFARLLETVPVRLLRYPRSYDALDGVLESVIADFEALL